MDEPSEPRSAAISAAPDPIGSRQSVPRGPSGPRRSETSPSEPVSAAIAGADVPYPGKLILQDGLEPLRARSAWTGSRRSGRWKAGPAGR